MTKKTKELKKELKYNEIINIRPHHLLCINGYQGYGYDSRFRENLNLIHDITFKNKDDNRDNETPKIAIFIENDDICKYCPNLTEDNYCKNKEEPIKIESMDYNVIKKLNLLNGDVIKYNNINKDTDTKNNNSVNNDNSNDNNIHNAYNINGKYWKQNIYSPKYLFNIINQKIKNIEDIRGICDNCSWESKCLFIKKLK